MKPQSIKIEVELNPDQALSLSQLVKRIGFSDVRANSVDEKEAYVMLEAISALQDSLASAGYSPI